MTQLSQNADPGHAGPPPRARRTCPAQPAEPARLRLCQRQSRICEFSALLITHLVRLALVFGNHTPSLTGMSSPAAPPVPFEASISM